MQVAALPDGCKTMNELIQNMHHVGVEHKYQDDRFVTSQWKSNKVCKRNK